MERQAEIVDEIGLIDVVRFCKEQWRLMVFLPIIAALAAVALVLNMQDRYAATSLLLVPAPLGPQGGASVLKDNAMLGVTAAHFELAKHYDVEGADKAKLSLLDNLKVTAGKDGLLEVSVTDVDPAFAAQLANYLVEQTRQRILGLHVTEQSKKYLVVQERIKAVQGQVSEARRQQKQLGSVAEAFLNSESARVIESFARLEAQMNAQQMEGNSPVQSSLLQLRAELERSNPLVKSISPRQLATMRDLFFYQATLEELQKQALVAKALMSQDVQVVLPASQPLEKAGPKRAAMVLLAGLGGVALAVLIGLGRKAWGSMRQRLQVAV
ncbi:hypothetical protein JW897_02570 [Chromobacterium alkanivorans]|uniref:hypothetical protein n=1 Tax=Chromobacterium alkanivorans TaxID=1071719 RepID=UPI00196781E5|nr:hypothetical protein [Chromobacterium alkanivorans]MBN3002612.1 hypothetical protein [Chromobacterium alkanivorans]